MKNFALDLPIISQFPNFLSLAAQQSKTLKRANTAAEDSEQESFQPDNHYVHRLGTKTNKKKIIVGSWSGKQNQIYLEFMLKNKDEFMTEKSRRTTKVFYRLSKILKKRTPDQCRSHHQKLQMKYKDDLDGIMMEVLRKVQRSIAQKFVTDYHHLFNSNAITSQKLKNTQLCETKKIVKSNHPNHQIEDFGWYRLKVRAKTVNIQIKEDAIEDWNQI